MCRFCLSHVLTLPPFALSDSFCLHRQLESYYTAGDANLDKNVDAFSQAARTKLQATSGFSPAAVYLGFAHGDEGPNIWYTPKKLARLSPLKKQWDPKQAFSNYNPVPLA